MIGYIVNPAPKKKAPKRKKAPMARTRKRKTTTRKRRTTRKGMATLSGRPAYRRRRRSKPNPVARRRPRVRRNKPADLLRDALIAGGAAAVVAAVEQMIADKNEQDRQKAAAAGKTPAEIKASLGLLGAFPSVGAPALLVNVALGVGTGMVLDKMKGATKRAAGPVTAGIVSYGIAKFVHDFIRARNEKEAWYQAQITQYAAGLTPVAATGRLTMAPGPTAAALAAHDVGAGLGRLYEGALPQVAIY